MKLFCEKNVDTEIIIILIIDDHHHGRRVVVVIIINVTGKVTGSIDTLFRDDDAQRQLMIA